MPGETAVASAVAVAGIGGGAWPEPSRRARVPSGIGVRRGATTGWGGLEAAVGRGLGGDREGAWRRRRADRLEAAATALREWGGDRRRRNDSAREAMVATRRTAARRWRGGGGGRRGEGGAARAEARRRLNTGRRWRWRLGMEQRTAARPRWRGDKMREEAVAATNRRRLVAIWHFVLPNFIFFFQHLSRFITFECQILKQYFYICPDLSNFGTIFFLILCQNCHICKKKLIYENRQIRYRVNTELMN